MESALIDRIVADVLEKIRRNGLGAPGANGTTAASPPVAEVNLPSRGEHSSSANVGSPFRCDDPVMTAETVEKLARRRPEGNARLVIGRKTVVTPAARDLLKAHGISWERGSAAGSTTNSGSTASTPDWQIVMTECGPAVKSLLKDLERLGGAGRPQLLSGVEETVRSAISAICRGEAGRVLALTPVAEVVACFANRNDRVRAAVVRDVRLVDAVREHLDANVWCVDPRGRSFVELRNLCRRILAGPDRGG